MELLKLSDENLALNLQKNQTDALEVLIDRYQSKLERYVNNILRDEDQADDAIQETFLAVYKNINSFDPRQKFSSWIYRIAHNKAINEIRKRSFFVGLEEAKEFSDQKNDSEQFKKQIDLKKGTKLVEEELGKMPLKYREVIYLRFFEDQSYEEISEILKIPKSTVGVRISRGVSKLKDKLNINIEDWL